MGFTRRRMIAMGAACAALGPAACGGDGSDGGGPLPEETSVTEASQGEASAEGISARSVEEAQKLAGLAFDEHERALVAEGAAETVAKFHARRRLALPNGLGPASVFDPRLPGMANAAGSSSFARRPSDPGPLPSAPEDVAFAPLSALSRWIERRELTSTALTGIYLDRLRAHGPGLECVVTLTEDLALRQAARADAEIAAGRHRGPLHGVPWGAKDLFDTAGIATTWGAAPYRDRVPDGDAAVVSRLEAAGAVLVAKLSLGALAYGDIWFGGKTRNPWNRAEGSSGSSAGSAAATAAGLVGFSLGTETLGSIVSPCMRCGATGLRPTFGRVPRTGAMALCWSLDKIGPICRTVEDTMLVLAALDGADPGDPSSRDVPLSYDGAAPVQGLRVGYDPEWFEGEQANDVDRRALDAMRRLPVDLVEISLPDLPYSALGTILDVEAAAAFEELTLTNRDDELTWQEPRAWPNSFRRTWFVPAIELVQAQRLRRRVQEVMAEVMGGVDALFGPSFAAHMLLITNNTGHPSLTLRAGFRGDGGPHGITLWGRLFDEGTIVRLGAALETELDVWHSRPPLA